MRTSVAPCLRHCLHSEPVGRASVGNTRSSDHTHHLHHSTCVSRCKHANMQIYMFISVYIECEMQQMQANAQLKDMHRFRCVATKRGPRGLHACQWGRRSLFAAKLAPACYLLVVWIGWSMYGAIVMYILFYWLPGPVLCFFIVWQLVL